LRSPTSTPPPSLPNSGAQAAKGKTPALGRASSAAAIVSAACSSCPSSLLQAPIYAAFLPCREYRW
jgi:hypothetical protein